MIYRKLGFAILASFSLSAFGADTRGLCQHETSVPNLPKAICHLPSCPSGSDCMPPTVERPSAHVEFNEPLLRWKDVCPDQTILGTCWEVYLDFKFKLSASDPAGVSHIGANLVSEVNARRSFKRHWGKADTKDSSGKYEMRGATIVHVPPGQRMEISVFELCARDVNANEGCVLPPKGAPMTLSR